MNKKTNNKKKMKYTVGGKVNTYVENPSDMLAENDIMMAQAQLAAETDPLVQGLNILSSIMGTAGNYLMSSAGSSTGKSTTTKAKYGGKVPVEVEGGEVAETPTGQLIDFNGPSHQNGGIDAALPPLTEIYSKKIKIDGKSLADRKKERENREKKFSKQADKGDAIGKNTLDRVKKANAIRDSLDKKIQDIFAVLEKQKENQAKQKFQTGGEVSNLEAMDPLEMLKKIFSTDPLTPTKGTTDFKMTSDHPPMSTYGDLKKNDRTNISDTFNMSFGDILGAAGNLYQSVSPYLNTLRSRSEDEPNVNAYRGFGEDALKSNEEALNYAQGILDNMLQDIELSSTAARKNLRNSSTGINTTRALDIATEGNKTRAQREAYNQFAQMVMNNLQQRAQLENVQDQMVMRGEEAKDLANRQDRDIYRTNIGQDKVNIGRGITEMGKFLNKSKERDVMETLLESMFSNTGIDPMTGELKGKGGKTPEDMVKDGSWKQATNNPNTKDGKYRTLQEFKTVNRIK